jgi:hypothetical protein
LNQSGGCLGAAVVSVMFLGSLIIIALWFFY